MNWWLCVDTMRNFSFFDASAGFCCGCGCDWDCDCEAAVTNIGAAAGAGAATAAAGAGAGAGAAATVFDAPAMIDSRLFRYEGS